jgi:peptidoglycan-associated lipoprotein
MVGPRSLTLGVALVPALILDPEIHTSPAAGVAGDPRRFIMMSQRRKTVWIASLIAVSLLMAGTGYGASDADIQAWRVAAQDAIGQARSVGADQWTHTDMVLAEESYRIGNYTLAKERADTAREKTLALKNLAGVSSRLSSVESTASTALATAQRAEAKADRAEANSLSALEQARQAELLAKQARDAADRAPAASSVIREGTLSSSTGPGAPRETALRDAYFDYDSSAVRPDARDALLTNAQWLKANPDVAVTIEGHCDERGTAEYNLALGQRRAQSARDVLVAAGIGPERISLISYGKERPFVMGHDESAWRWNRRAHFVAGTAPGPQVSGLR